MPRWCWIVAGLAVLLVAVVALLPLRFVVERHGIVAEDVSGSLWHGQMIGANWHGIALGDLETRARLWPPAMMFEGPVMRGRLTATGVEALSGNIENFGGLPLTQIALDGVTVAMDKGGCTFAAGRVAVIATPLPQLGALSGPLRCENGMLRAVLTPEQGDASVDLSLDAERRYRARLRVGGLPETVRMFLVMAGFEATETGVAMSREGRL